MAHKATDYSAPNRQAADAAQRGARERAAIAEGVEQAIQYVEEFDGEDAARDAHAWFFDQQGYLGGRVLEPGPSKPRWRVQVFFEDDGPRDGWLPDGCRRVVIPAGQRAALGLK